MREGTIARQYAETLFELGLRVDRAEEYGTALAELARLLDAEPRLRALLETPRVDDEEKKALIRRVFGERLPRHVLHFVLVTIDKRRQRLLREIEASYSVLLDEHLGREHVEVTVARPLDDATTAVVAERLSDMLGRKAIPHVRVQPEILGGLVVRTGDTIYDGSVRRRLETMRRRLLAAELPATADGTR